jgi:hypothetical protein
LEKMGFLLVIVEKNELSSQHPSGEKKGGKSPTKFTPQKARFHELFLEKT